MRPEHWLYTIALRLRSLFRGVQADRELDDELRDHLERATEEYVAKGMAPVEARRRARLDLGGIEQTKEKCRDVKLLRWLDSIVRDTRYGSRILCKSPIVTAATILSLALAIGACTAAYSLIDALILRPLPVRDPEGLVYVTYPSDRLGAPEHDSFNYPLFERLRDASHAKVELFSVSWPRPRDATLGNSTEKIPVQFVSGDALAILGVKPALGRLLTAEDDRYPGESPAAVVSYEFWMRQGSRPDILSQQLDYVEPSPTTRTRNTKRSLQIVGVLQRGFTGVEPGAKVDAWIPNMMFTPEAFTNADWDWLLILGRPKSYVTREQAQQLMQQTLLDFQHDHPRDSRKQINVRSAANGGPSGIRKAFERPLWILAIFAGLVLLIAGSNVANLLVARSAAREREMALRLSIGAGRRRLVQQLLIESGLLASMACLLGIGFAQAVGPAVVSRLLPTGESAYLDLGLNWRVLGFLALIGASATAVVGLIPAFRSSSVSPGEVLRAGSNRHSTRRGLLRPLVAAQVAFSVTVLFTGGLLLLSFQKLSTLDLGFFRSGIVFFDLDGLGERGQPAALQLLDSVRQFPEVQAAAYSAWALLNDNQWISKVKISGRTDSGQTYQLGVSPGFFDTMGIRLLEGRDFARRDLGPNASAVVVNEAFARSFFPGQSVVGKQFDRDGDLLEIVGLVRDAKYLEIRETPSPTIYVPLRGQLDEDGDAVLTVRAADAGRIAPLLRQEILSADPSVKVSRVTLQTTLIDNLLVRDRLLALLSGFFGIVALLLVAIGTYGVLNYSVVQRTREIGIRMALGAPAFQVIRLVISEIAGTVALGVVAGLGGGFVLGHYVTSLLFEVKPGHAATVFFPLLGLMLVCLFAVLPPTLRASRLNPVVALRQE